MADDKFSEEDSPFLDPDHVRTCFRCNLTSLQPLYERVQAALSKQLEDLAQKLTVAIREKVINSCANLLE